MEQVHQVLLNMLLIKDLEDILFNCIYPWGETLSSIAWAIRISYHRTILATPGRTVFGRDILFNLASVGDWRVATNLKQLQVDIDNVRENAK